MEVRLLPAAFGQLPGWEEDDVSGALAAFRRSADHLKSAKPYRTGALGVSVTDFAAAFDALATLRAPTTGEARQFFERHFTPFKIVGAERSGFVTAYYEPEVSTSADPGGPYRYPFYRPPADLVEINPADGTPLAAAGFAYGRSSADGVIEYHDRAAIEQGALEGRELEIAWARDRIDVFFAHIQGAARLVHADGRVQRITYAAKSGHPFTAIGRVLIGLGEIPAAEVTMARLREWLLSHPVRLDEILWRNRSFIFFREAETANPADGPIAAAKVPLTAARSLAVDRAIHTFATPFFIDAPTLTHLSAGKRFRRLMIAQDSGSAIVGPARGDIFTGSGAAAGDLAGSVKHDADFYILLPRPTAEGVAQ